MLKSDWRFHELYHLWSVSHQFVGIVNYTSNTMYRTYMHQNLEFRKCLDLFFAITMRYHFIHTKKLIKLKEVTKQAILF